MDLLEFGNRHIVGMNYTRYVSLPKDWLRTNRLDAGDIVKLSLTDEGALKITKLDSIEKKEKSNSKNLYFDNVETVIYSERDTHAGDITINPSPPRALVKRKSWVDILGNSASIASFIIALVGILLQFFINFQYAVILIILGIVIFVLFAIN